jgi:inosine-uridine nucleoside N-ribohydrolase/sugar/nucleoside kinase (ribokinase family)
VRDHEPFPVVHGERGLGHAELPVPSRAPSSRSAAQFLVEAARDRPGEVLLVATGPLTNVALALAEEPRLPDLLAGFALMGGSYAQGGNATPAAEANTWVDPDAAQAVFRGFAGRTEAKLPQCVGLDVTQRVQLSREGLASMVAPAPGSLIGAFLGDAVPFYIEFYERTHDFGGACMHDPLALALAIDPSMATWTSTRVEVEADGTWTRGMTVTDSTGSGTARGRWAGNRRTTRSWRSTSTPPRSWTCSCSDCDRWWSGRREDPRRDRRDQRRPRGARPSPAGARTHRGRGNVRAAPWRQGREPGGRRGAGARPPKAEWPSSGRLARMPSGSRPARSSRWKVSRSNTSPPIGAPRRGFALIAVDADGQNQISVAPGANAWLTPEMVTASLDAIGEDVGAVLASLEVPLTAVEAGGRWCNERGVTFVLNPAPARPEVHDLLPLATHVTPNETEILVLTAQAEEPRGAVARLSASYPELQVIATLGAGGAIGRGPGGDLREAGLKVRAVDTTGAGDCFNGVLAASLLEGKKMSKALHRACVAASLSVTSDGAREGMPDREAIEAALKA